MKSKLMFEKLLTTIAILVAGLVFDSATAVAQTDIMSAIQGDDAKSIKLLIKNDTKIVSQPLPQNRMTPLQFAIQNGKVEATRVLLAVGAPIGNVNNQKQTPTDNIKDIEFAKIKDHSLKLDLYLPEKTEKSALVVWIHGGGWQEGSKKDCKLDWLTEHGYSVASISYRLSQVAKFPAQLHDCKGAIRWLRANSSKYGFETNHIVVAGSSAGGHLAALIGTTSGNEQLEGDVGGNLSQPSSVSAIIDYYGPTDFILRSKTQPSRANEVGSVVYNLLGGGADKKVELAKLASAAHHVTNDDPPLLIFHGDEDKTVLIDQSEAITKIYKSKGLSVQMNVLSGKKHGGADFYQGENRQRVLKFLDEVLKPKS